MTEYIIRDLSSAVSYLPYGLMAGALAAVILSVINNKRKRLGKKPFDVAALTVFYIYLAILAAITFFSRESGSRNGIDLKVGSTLGINRRNDAFVVENILLFVPFGVVTPWAFESLRNFWGGILFGAAVSTGIECLQMITARGYFQIDDILTNTLGMAVGCLVFFLLHKVSDVLGRSRRIRR
ncbi:MAG: VanZ family protein [Lachnospiraceae bacterium]|nr:VanZ family protein [Lachnospiraceae bacterium]